MQNNMIIPLPLSKAQIPEHEQQHSIWKFFLITSI